MLSDFLRYIEENRMTGKGDRILLAVSGGIDSMVMAHLFTRTCFETGIAHCNFCLRGKESDRDEELVRKFASDNDIIFFSKRFDTKKYAGEKGISIQVAARELRYGWFEEVIKKNGFSRTAVAHNLNDNIETMLINLTRGTGVTGLTGMRPVNNRIIRPLLFATRETISIYCKSKGIKYREDRSNAETKYTRNKIRSLVIPVLREINPSIEATLQKTAERLRDTDDIVTYFMKELKQKILFERDGDTILKLAPLRLYIENSEVLYELTEQYAMTGPLLNDLKNIIAGPSGGRILTETHRILKNRQELIVTPLSGFENESVKIDSIADLRKVPFIASVISINITLNFRIPSDRDTACLDQNKFRFPVIIRRWHMGDYFIPLGMKRRKKLSDFFTDLKYSVPQKERALILESDGMIAWIAGERIDERFRITTDTKRALIIKAQRLKGRGREGGKKG
ncbi:MAG: tRNA lysidine(34) synthetase TilS [Bacteroidota bacterium]